MLKQEIILKFPYKAELHCHTKPASVCSDIPPREVIENYKESGYDIVVITNHFNSSVSTKEAQDCYIKDFREAYKAGKELGVNVIFGMELRFDENANDYLYFGVDPCEVEEISKNMQSLESFVKNYKKEQSVLFQAHPFRNGQEPMPAQFLDGIEVFNLHPNHNSRVGMAAKYAQQNGLCAIAGTDYHHKGQHGLTALRFESNPCDSFELARILKEKNYVLDISGLVVVCN